MGVRPDQATALERYFLALTGDRDAGAGLFAEDYDEIYPQSGERIVGGTDAMIAARRQPTGLSLLGGPHLTACGEDRVFVEALLDYGGSRSWSVALFELHGGRLHHSTAYFGEPFEAPDWRAAWAERYDPLDSAAWAGEGDGQPVERSEFEMLIKADTAGRYAETEPWVHPDYRASFPQSGERFDYAGLRAVDERYPGGLPQMQPTWAEGETERWIVNPANVPIRVSGGTDTWVSEVLLHYPAGDRFNSVSVQIFRQRRLWRQRFYYVPSFEAAAFRADLVERFDPEVALG